MPSFTGPVFLRIQALFCSGWVIFREGTGTTCTVMTESQLSHKVHPLNAFLWEWVVNEREIQDFEDKI